MENLKNWCHEAYPDHAMSGLNLSLEKYHVVFIGNRKLFRMYKEYVS